MLLGAIEHEIEIGILGVDFLCGISSPIAGKIQGRTNELQFRV